MYMLSSTSCIVYVIEPLVVDKRGIRFMDATKQNRIFQFIINYFKYKFG